MAKGRDRPRKEPKRKPKEEGAEDPVGDPDLSASDAPGRNHQAEAQGTRTRVRAPGTEPSRGGVSRSHRGRQHRTRSEPEPWKHRWQSARARRRRTRDGERIKAVDAAILQIEKQFGHNAIMPLGRRRRRPNPRHLAGSVALDLALGVGGSRADVSPRSSGRSRAARRRSATTCGQCPAHRRHRGLHRCRARARPELRQERRRRRRRAPRQPAGHRRAGARDRRDADALGRRRRRDRRLGRGARAAGGDRGRHGRCLRGPAGTPDEPGAAQADRRDQPQPDRRSSSRTSCARRSACMFGSPETTPGGRALKFYASVRLDIRRIETLKTGTDAIGSRTRVKVVKNKVASPFRVAEFDIMYNEGISVEGGLLDVGIAAGILSKTGAWFNYGDIRLGQGRENSRDFLKQNPEIAARRSTMRSAGRSRASRSARRASARRSRSGAGVAKPSRNRRAEPRRGSRCRACARDRGGLPRHPAANALGGRAAPAASEPQRTRSSRRRAIGSWRSATSMTRPSPGGGGSSGTVTRHGASA